jgi:hypothetical protein
MSFFKERLIEYFKLYFDYDLLDATKEADRLEKFIRQDNLFKDI